MSGDCSSTPTLRLFHLSLYLCCITSSNKPSIRPSDPTCQVTLISTSKITTTSIWTVLEISWNLTQSWVKFAFWLNIHTCGITSMNIHTRSHVARWEQTCNITRCFSAKDNPDIHFEPLGAYLVFTSLLWTWTLSPTSPELHIAFDVRWPTQLEGQFFYPQAVNLVVNIKYLWVGDSEFKKYFQRKISLQKILIITNKLFALMIILIMLSIYIFKHFGLFRRMWAKWKAKAFHLSFFYVTIITKYWVPCSSILCGFQRLPG